MPRNDGEYLSKREQQIMDLAYQRERITANDLTTELPGEPSNSTVRTLLRILEEKGQLTHVVEDGKFVYSPVKPRQVAAKSALSNVVETFFRGSVRNVVATLLDDRQEKLSDEDLTALQEMIDRARKEGR
jgi:predicted transcriptional regulator